MSPPILPSLDQWPVMSPKIRNGLFGSKVKCIHTFPVVAFDLREFFAERLVIILHTLTTPIHSHTIALHNLLPADILTS